jgi:glycosyltransferase involved in cell wall biosynthesis
MKVSIVIPVYNASAHIGDVIDACRGIDYPDLEIVAVDDGSSDGSADIAASHGAKVIRQENGGPAKARNSGWRAAGGEICFFTDSDCFPKSDAIKRLAKHFEERPVAAAGGTYDIANPEKILPRLIHAEIAARHASMPKDADFLGSFNLAVRRETLEEIGGFNEEYKTASAEDNDLSYRIRKSGKKMVFDISAAVAHRHEESLTRYLKQQYNHGKWRVKLYNDHKDMKSGDSYSGLFDFIQPVLGLTLFLTLPMAFIESTRHLYLLLLLVYTALQFPMPIRMAISTGRMENLLMPAVTFFRGIARGLGLTAGVLKFGI